MASVFLRRLGWFFLLLLLQVLVFNHIHFLDYGTPLVYVFFLCTLTSKTPRWVFLTTTFAIGLIIDIFNNTLGMAAASFCATGFIAPLLMPLFTPPDKEKDDLWTPTASAMEWKRFLYYTFCLVTINTVLFTLIEAFTFSNWHTLLLTMGGSLGMSFLFIVSLETIRNSGTKNGKQTQFRKS